jgi:hypothetical protein
MSELLPASNKDKPSIPKTLLYVSKKIVGANPASNITPFLSLALDS